MTSKDKHNAMLQVELCPNSILPNEYTQPCRTVPDSQFIESLSSGLNFDSERHLTAELLKRRLWIECFENYLEVYDKLTGNELIYEVFSWDVPEGTVLLYLIVRGTDGDDDLLLNLVYPE